jgi:hypothetical protein
MATGQTHGGKGSTTRPTDKKKYEDNWDTIFGKKKEKEQVYKAVNEVLRKEKLKGENNETNR